jgi:hypothetical protein
VCRAVGFSSSGSHCFIRGSAARLAKSAIATRPVRFFHSMIADQSPILFRVTKHCDMTKVYSGQAAAITILLCT